MKTNSCAYSWSVSIYPVHYHDGSGVWTRGLREFPGTTHAFMQGKDNRDYSSRPRKTGVNLVIRITTCCITKSPEHINTFKINYILLDKY